MSTVEEINRFRKLSKEDTIRKTLMSIDKRDVVELYLQLRFDKAMQATPKIVELERRNAILTDENTALKQLVEELQKENETLKGERV